jgi:hypothetical protein
MQVVVAKIEILREKDPHIIDNDPRIRKLISETAQGKDAWHHKYLFFTRPGGSARSYVLISLGSDDRADFSNPEEYFTLPESFTHDKPWRDIVFRDGQAITHAGK